ncbi:hypothetical protein ITJ64_08050 [Herbiconiux sp. VKM Ac-1786]|uniref:hypothetical protein n=1 Tax=Herbiconiux sp. VKM Ac-1786 TaxID=2783824 RepID=UPI00188D32FE|nr:hypothetical protein [Herbiconiux sp. VKM Ac-1786]MBF4572466.1 hypothetical protein [Herbiconiux sp. VKM Ac-1786]
MDIALVLDGNRGAVSAERARLRLELVDIVRDVDFGVLKTDAAVPRLEALLDAAKSAA